MILKPRTTRTIPALSARPGLFVLAGLAAALALPRAARAQDLAPPEAAPAAAPAAATTTITPGTAPAGGFGLPGTLVFSMETSPDDGSGFLFFHKVTGGGSSNFQFNPAADYFISNGISVGGNLNFNYQSGGSGSSATTLGVGVRVGYDLPLASTVTFWPSARFFVDHTNNTQGTTTSFAIFAPFLWHPAPHFFLGLGPDYFREISTPSYNVFGLDFVIGGWL